MTSLTLTLGNVFWKGISTLVTRVGEADGRRTSRMTARKVVVSAGRTGATTIDVSPGEYLVEATLPTGDLVTGMCTVAGDDPVSVDIGRLHSFDGSVAGIRLPRQGERDFQFPSAAGMLSMSLLDAGEEPDIFTTPVQPRPDPVTSSDSLAPAGYPSRGAQAPGTASSGVRLRFPLASRVVTGIDGTMSYEMDGQGASGAPGPLWMEFTKGKQVRKVMLPLPWLPDLDTSKRLPEQARIRVDLPQDGKPRVSVADAKFEAMIGYLTTRRISEARTALETVADEVVELSHVSGGELDTTVPFAFLAACYVGILEQDESTERWGRLAEQLHRSCPTSVDAMVVTARHLLVTACDTDGLTRARSLFLQASEGPPPTFTIGVQILLDGLSAFADEDERVAARRRDFLGVARSVDTGQPFTVLTSSRNSE